MQTTNLVWEWQWAGGLTAVWLFLALCYAYGWHHGRWADHTPAVQPRYFWAAMALLAFVWLSPLHSLASQLFLARTLQRLLLVGVVPLLFWLSNPTAVLHAALPARAQQWLQQQSYGRGAHYQQLLTASSPRFAWLLFVCYNWLWYDATLHQLTLRYGWLHSFELLTLLLAALPYWWHILGTPPILHQPMHPIVRIVYVLIGSGPVKIAGLILLFSSQNIYNYPATIELTGLHIDDQNMAGILIWLLGGVSFTWTAGHLMRQWLSLEEDKPYLAPHLWATEENMRAPGFEPKPPSAS